MRALAILLALHSVVAPQIHFIDSAGTIRGGTDPRIVAAARSLAELCRREELDGIQLDLENIHVGDRDAFTAFAREAADSAHRAGCQLSAAVVPRTDDDRGALPYHRFMYDYWRGAYDYKALADALDFTSYMTYANLTEMMRAAGVRPVWDRRQKAWYAMWERNGVFEHAWIEDARAFKEKLALVRRHRLRGHSVWLLGLEDPRTWDVVGPVRR